LYKSRHLETVAAGHFIASYNCINALKSELVTPIAEKLQ